MERTYRIHLIVEGTFARKVKARQVAREMLDRLDVKEPWSKAGTRVVSKAVRQRTVKPREPSEDEKVREFILAQARRIVDEMRAASPNLPRVTVRWLNDGGCGYSTGNPQAHAHRGRWWTNRGKGKRVRLPRNLICLVAPWTTRHVDRVTGEDSAFWSTSKRIRVPLSDESMAWLIAHEICHMKFTSKTHRATAFHDAVRAALEKWKERASTPSDRASERELRTSEEDRGRGEEVG